MALEPSLSSNSSPFAGLAWRFTSEPRCRIASSRPLSICKASWRELAGVRVFSETPFTAVKAMANSSSRKSLRRRLEEKKKEAVQNSARFKASAQKAGSDSTGQFAITNHTGKGSETNGKLNSAGCALSPPPWKQSRRVVSISFFLSNLLLPNDAMAASIFDKYVKRKKLDPLDVYVPPVILAQLQIRDLERNLEEEKPGYETCRSLLRSGPASSLRVAQYASDAGNGNAAFEDVERCLRSLEELDSLLLRAVRKDQGASIETMKANLGTALTALDSLLQTVPSEILDRGKAMVDVYRSSSSQTDDVSEDSPEIQQLQSIL
ncbi:PREDICTED: uncharacterized protein LOC104819519 isoform X2 [Tarenaya hassleriana]|uniref:uncharacterized protein LOC104819519 isoform X2 n=1 Tax=Tarenaya hassleriana TaxID=28532 RepID=UPI00053C16D4|nr:PREDICTED: uncharacterized protein LOC104819519 isoform X2 [Tarenaya hassleriana]